MHSSLLCIRKNGGSFITIAGLVSSVGRALASKLRGPGFKSRPGTVGGPGHYNNVGCSARLEISFELNLLQRVNQVTLLYFTLISRLLISFTSFRLVAEKLTNYV